MTFAGEVKPPQGRLIGGYEPGVWVSESRRACEARRRENCDGGQYNPRTYLSRRSKFFLRKFFVTKVRGLKSWQGPD